MAAIMMPHQAHPVPQGLPFATVVAQNGRYIADQYGNPWMVNGDSAWGMAQNLSLADMGTYLSTRQSQGFNCVLTEFVTDTYSGISTTNAESFDGINAFTGTVTGPYPDLTTPNPPYWARMDTMVAMAAGYGITLFVVPADTANQFGDSYMMSAVRANGHTSCVTFGAFLGNRYKTAPNVVWLNGNDYGSGTDDTYVGGISDGIRSAAPAMLQTVEQTVNGTPTYALQPAPWIPRINLDFCYVTGLNDTQYTICNSAYAATPTMPMFNGEGMYEGDSGWSTNQLRHQVYRPFMAGGSGSLFGPLPTVYGFTSGWQSDLATTATTEFTYCGKLFATLPWWRLVPDLANTFMTSGFSSGSTLATAAADSLTAGKATTVVAYVPTNGPVVCDMTKMRGSTVARWYDPTAGTFSTIGTFANTGTQSFTNPAAHGDGTADYALVLTA